MTYKTLHKIRFNQDLKNNKRQTVREAGTESHGSLSLIAKIAGLLRVTTSLSQPRQPAFLLSYL